jgi:DNA-binding NtrC family response regulator
VRPSRAILLVESDPPCGLALARLVRRGGDRVRLVRTPGAATLAARREGFDVAVVDLLVKGGGVDLARRLTRHVPRVYLSVGARLLGDELVEAALGFPVLHKADLARRLGPRRGPRRRRMRGPAHTHSLPD